MDIPTRLNNVLVKKVKLFKQDMITEEQFIYALKEITAITAEYIIYQSKTR